MNYSYVSQLILSGQVLRGLWVSLRILHLVWARHRQRVLWLYPRKGQVYRARRRHRCYSCSSNEVLQGLISDQTCLLQDQENKQTRLNLREAKQRHEVCLLFWTKGTNLAQWYPWNKEAYDYRYVKSSQQVLNQIFLISTLFSNQPLWFFATESFKSPMWQKFHFFSTLHEEASEKLSILFPSTSVQGSDSSQRPGSKEPNIVLP